MLFTYLKIAFRNAFKNKSIAFLNVANLSIGLASAIAVYVVLWGGLSLNSLHEKIDELYQVKSYAQDLHKSYVSGATSALLADAMIDEIPEVKEACRIIYNKELIGYIDNNVKEAGVYADASILSIFTFPLTYGNPETALNDPNSIIISESMSKKLFKDENPVTQTINMYSIHEEMPEVFTITGVFKENDELSSLQFEYVIPFNNYIKNHRSIQSWGYIGTRTYVELHPGTNPHEVGKKITSIIQERNPSAQEYNRAMLLVPFKNNHLYQGARSPGNYGPQFYVMLVIGIIGVLILLVSIINYINLTTSWSIKRAKEVGIRKITGAGQKSLKLQFLSETFIIVVISVMLAVLLSNVGIYYLEKMMHNKTLHLPFDNWQFLLGILILLVITVFTAGWIPASVLIRFAPAKVMKNNLTTSPTTRNTRKFMVVTQFMLAIFLIIATLALKRQVDAIANQSHGFDRYHIVCLKNNKNLVKHKNAFTNEINQVPELKHVTYSSHLPVSITESSRSFRWENKDPLDNTYFSFIYVDQEFCKTININIKSGHGFTKEASSPQQRMVIVNETAAKYMVIKEPVGSIINVHGRDHEIVGVTENFQYNDAIGKIEPLFIIYNPEQTNWCLVKLHPDNPDEGLASLKEIYQTYAPDFPFDYRFLDSYFDEMHKPLFNSIYFLYYSAAFAILIACLGLLGLTMFTTSRKIKEIGVRKVNGAHRRNILSLIMNQFFRQVFIAFLLASPIAFLLVNKILQFFTYQEPLGWDLFALTFILVFLIVLVTVGGQSWRAASRNPVEALRYE